MTLKYRNFFEIEKFILNYKIIHLLMETSIKHETDIINSKEGITGLEKYEKKYRNL